MSKDAQIVCISVYYSSGPETTRPLYLYLSAYLKSRTDLVLIVLRL